MIRRFMPLALLLAASALHAQLFYPLGSHVNLYFPHLADGGAASQNWQTTFIFDNPSLVDTASVSIDLYADDGSALSLDFGSGPQSTLLLTVPPNGSVFLRSTGASSSIVTGWAFAASNIPVQATILFRANQNGVASVELAAPATLPSPEYRSYANRFLGVALANPYSSASVPVIITVLDSSGNQLAQTSTTLDPLAHTSFNIYTLFPGLADFTGSIDILAANTGDQFVGWTLNGDAQVLSTLPPGEREWPISHWDRIWLAYNRTYAAANDFLLGAGYPSLTSSPATNLNISFDNVINAFSSPDGTVTINIALSELISDSPSELAFAVAHELGHQIQFKTGLNVWVPDNAEYDADQWGMIFSLLAGFDPYASAGALSKLAMASGQAGLVDQNFDNISGDLHGSFNNRVELVFQTIQAICALPDLVSVCQSYKSVVHPHIPPPAPLVRKKGQR